MALPSLSTIATVTTGAQALANLVLVSPQSTVGYQPTSSDGEDLDPAPNAFLFHYEGEQTASLESDITDHYVEDNTARQDQIALRPVEITTQGYIGELNDVPPFALAIIQSLAQKLTTISAYTPQFSVFATNAYNEAFQAYQLAANIANTAVSAWGSITGSGGESVVSDDGTLTVQSSQNRQQVAFQTFYGYWNSRTLFTIQTPWAVFENMAIKSLRAIQSEETNVFTTFAITFKPIRTAETITNGPPISDLGGRAAAQGSALINSGTSALSPATLNFGDALATMVG